MNGIEHKLQNGWKCANRIKRTISARSLVIADVPCQETDPCYTSCKLTHRKWFRELRWSTRLPLIPRLIFVTAKQKFAITNSPPETRQLDVVDFSCKNTPDTFRTMIVTACRIPQTAPKHIYKNVPVDWWYSPKIRLYMQCSCSG